MYTQTHMSTKDHGRRVHLAIAPRSGDSSASKKKKCPKATGGGATISERKSYGNAPKIPATSMPWLLTEQEERRPSEVLAGAFHFHSMNCNMHREQRTVGIKIKIVRSSDNAPPHLETEDHVRIGLAVVRLGDCLAGKLGNRCVKSLSSHRPQMTPRRLKLSSDIESTRLERSEEARHLAFLNMSSMMACP